MIPESHASATPDALTRLKQRQATSISVCIPARDEESTVGTVVDVVRRELCERTELVDEVLVIDDGSTDATAERARSAGARVVATSEILPWLPAGSGKGNAMWLALYESEGELLCFLDADLRNFDARFVTALIEPLLVDDRIVMVKAQYRRPFGDEPTGGGRVTELLARPLLALLFPELAYIAQPLAGECATRRSALETVPFVEGWGVEIGLLIDLARRFGVAAVAQAHLGVREHRNRPLAELAPQARAVLATGLARAGIEVASSRLGALAELTSIDDDGGMARRVPTEVRERLPMLEIPAYRARFDRERSA